MFTEAVEESESEDEVTESLDGEMGERLRPMSSVDEDSFPLILETLFLTGGRVVDTVEQDPSSSCELDLTRFDTNWCDEGGGFLPKVAEL